MNRPLEDAKNHLSKVAREARSDGPQIVRVRSERAAVVLSATEYDALPTGRRPLVDDLLSGPSWDGELAEAVDARAKTSSRSVEFECTSSTPT